MPKLILLVEDEETNRALFLDILEVMLEQEVLIAEDGLKAILMAHEHRPDLILMDLTLPKMDGWQVTRSLRSTEAFRHIPILAITAHAMVGDRERALEAGCNDHFAKPIDLDAFIEFLQPYLQEGGAKE